MYFVIVAQNISAKILKIAKNKKCLLFNILLFRKGFTMERFVWIAKVKPGKLEEYKKRHDEIWPEMTEVLNLAGIHNYSIWNIGEQLIGYYECESIEHATKVQRESEVVDRWNEYMKDVMEMEMDPDTGTSVLLEQVFFHK